MELGLFNKVKLKLNEWFVEPIGEPPTPDNTSTELKKPSGSFGGERSRPDRAGGRGAKREPPPHITEFHPRGTAGRREVRGPRNPGKAVMSHKGNRPKYPK